MDVSPLSLPRADYELATLHLPDTQLRSYTKRVWSYETFIEFEQVINRYLVFKTLEDLNMLLITIFSQYLHMHIISK
jgi:hypothetical protein